MHPNIPRVGLGTFNNTVPNECVETVRSALEMGYRHIDTAIAYDNEREVGDGIRQASVDRDDIFLASKVWRDKMAPEAVLSETKASRERLGVDTIDLMYVHWPAETYVAEETLPAFDELVDKGVISHIGVSNFEPDQLTEAQDILDAPIYANQVEMHPFCPQHELVERAQQDNHWLVAYCPLARGAVFDHPVIVDVAKEHDITPAQATLAWLLTKENVIPIPKATGNGHLRENLAATDVSLSSSAVSRIDAIETRERQVDPAWAPWND